MGLLVASFPMILFLIIPTSLSHPTNTRIQSLILANGIFPGVMSPVNLTNPVRGYPVYPIICLPSPSHGSYKPAADVVGILSDCFYIINMILLRQDGLLFQDLFFNYNLFSDRSGKRYLSHWHHGRCTINVINKGHVQTLQLFNVVLAANKILRECVENKHIPDGGITHIRSSDSSFYVAVGGRKDSNTAYKSLSSNSEQNIQHSLLHTNPDADPSFEDYDTTDSMVSLPPNVSVEKRASGPQHGSSLSTGTQTLTHGEAVSDSNPDPSSANLSKRLEAPPDYPIHCFNPYSVKLKPAGREDCQFVINQIILRYPNPMLEQTFGYGASVDIDLSLPENEKWVWGHCVIFVRNMNKSRTDTFRMVDVALTAHRIMTECVIGVKYPVGGSADVGTAADNFYVGVGGLKYDGTNTSILQQISSVDRVDDRIGTHGNL